MNYIELEDELINLDQAKAIYRQRLGENDLSVGYRIIFDLGGYDRRVIEFGGDKEQWLYDWDRIVGRVIVAAEVPNDG